MQSQHLGLRRQEDYHKLEVSLGYIVRSKTAKATLKNTCLKKKIIKLKIHFFFIRRERESVCV